MWKYKEDCSCTLCVVERRIRQENEKHKRATVSKTDNTVEVTVKHNGAKTTKFMDRKQAEALGLVKKAPTIKKVDIEFEYGTYMIQPSTIHRAKVYLTNIPSLEGFLGFEYDSTKYHMTSALSQRPVLYACMEALASSESKVNLKPSVYMNEVEKGLVTEVVHPIRAWFLIKG